MNKIDYFYSIRKFYLVRMAHMIRDRLMLQKRELESKFNEKYIERMLDAKKFDNDLIKVIIGPRRAGKSFLAIHLLKKLKKFAYVNFDDEYLTSITNYDEIIAEINLMYNQPKHLLFDEIQNLPKWELFANRLQRQGSNLVLTGSNSKLLSKELATHLTGRHLVINIFPFSFKEYLALEEKELTAQETRAKLHEYITLGGYPEPLIKKLDYKDYLSTLFDSTIYKDIVKRFNIRFPNDIEDLAQQLLANTAKEFSYNNLAKTTKLKSVSTVQKYLGYLEEAFLFFQLDRFSYKPKEQIASNKKIYCIDNGFINAKAFKTSQNLGRLYENAAAICLKKMELDKTVEIYYWKNQQQEEVDFVIKQGIKIQQLIQVCYDINDLETKNREIRALLKASKELKCKNLLVITDDKEGEEEIAWFGTKRRIRYAPLWKWLLG